jgi:hypothetical protein
MELLRDVGQVEAHFGTFRDSVSLSARYVLGSAKRTIGSKISLAARFVRNVTLARKYFLASPDGTPR